MINVTSNPALKLALLVSSALVAFTTDGTAAVSTTGNIGGGAGYMTLASTAGMAPGDFLSVEGANSAGTGPWYSTILGAQTATNVNVSVPAARIAVTGAVVNRFERIETRYRAKKATLTNNTTGDVFVWDQTLLDGQAYKTSGGTTTTLTSNGILNRSNCIAIHPNLLPPNCSFTLLCEYEYHG